MVGGDAGRVPLLGEPEQIRVAGAPVRLGERGRRLAAGVAADTGVGEPRSDPGFLRGVVAGRVGEAPVVVALVADLGDEDVRERMGFGEPTDTDVGLGVQRRGVRWVEQRRGLEQGGGERRRLGEVKRVAGVHPARR